MQKSFRLMATVLFLGAYLLSACTGAAPQSDGPVTVKAQKVSASEVVFTGIVEAMNGDQWTVSGQQVTVDASTALDANIKVGDVVKVEANVSQDGSVLAVKIEASLPDDTNSNSSNDNSNGNNNGNGNDAVDGQNEVIGVVDAITSDTITIDGVVYNLADFTEFKNGIVTGDQVKIHVIVNADGTFTISEIEKSAGIGDDDNSNGNFNGDDQVGNSNSNSNDDDHVGNSNGNFNGDDLDDSSDKADSHSGGSNDNSSDDDHNGSNSSSGSDDHGGDSNSNDD